MALKFLNKKGWHTGSLRNIENVWKAEQKHDAEQKKLEELRKQIQEERERSEFRLLQEKAGLVPKQERLEFLYDSGLSVGRTENSEGFKALEAFPKPDAADAPSSSASASKQQPSAPGALFEDKPQSANDAWRKLHSDPLLMIRQREQEALARIKNNPIKMAMIQKSVKGTENQEKDRDKKKHRKKHRHSSSKHHRNSSPRQQSDSEDDTVERRKRKTDKRIHSDSESDSMEGERKIKKKHDENKKYKERPPRHHSRQDTDDRYYSKKHDDDKNYKERSPRHLSRQDTDDRYYSKKHNDDKKYEERSPRRLSRQDTEDRYYSKSKSERYASEGQSNGDDLKRGRDSERENRSFPDASSNRSSHYKHRNTAPKLTDEERAAKLKQMQLAAELHEEQRWKRLKNAEENDAKEAIIQSSSSGGRNFLDAAQKSVYGAAEGGSSSIAESVRRRTHYSQGRSEAGEGNAFRR